MVNNTKQDIGTKCFWKLKPWNFLNSIFPIPGERKRVKLYPMVISKTSQILSTLDGCFVMSIGWIEFVYCWFSYSLTGACDELMGWNGLFWNLSRFFQLAFEELNTFSVVWFVESVFLWTIKDWIHLVLILLLAACSFRQASGMLYFLFFSQNRFHFA